MTKAKKNILVATGGTGGHIFPAISLANFLIKNNYELSLTTDKRGYKYLKDFDELNLNIISSGTIFSKNPFIIISGISKVLFSILKSIVFLQKLKPSIVFGMGGYSSFPVCVAAKLLNIPFIIYENNLLLGKTNKILLPFAKKLFVSYKEVEGIEKKYNFKSVCIGNIIREEIFNYRKNNILKDNNLLNLLVLGGSQAAKIFGKIIPPILKKLKENDIQFSITQQCLISQKNDLEKFYKANNIKFDLFNYSQRIFDYYKNADLVITRAGSSVLAELLNCRIPMISIPLPSSADNHQLKNAKYFEKKGFGYLIEENTLRHNLFNLIKSIHKDKSLLNKIYISQKNHSDENVFKNINIELKKIFDEKN